MAKPARRVGFPQAPHMIKAVLEMNDRGFTPETSVFATESSGLRSFVISNRRERRRKYSATIRSLRRRLKLEKRTVAGLTIVLAVTAVLFAQSPALKRM
jgi:hypothetical protein